MILSHVHWISNDPTCYEKPNFTVESMQWMKYLPFDHSSKGSIMIFKQGALTCADQTD